MSDATRRENEERNRKGAAAIPGAGSGAPPELLLGNGLRSGSAVVGGGGRGLGAAALRLLGGRVGSFLVAASVLGSSVYGLYSTGMSQVRDAARPARKGSIFAKPAYDAAVARSLPTEQGPGGDSLGGLASANKGAFDEQQAPQQAEAQPAEPSGAAPAPQAEPLLAPAQQALDAPADAARKLPRLGFGGSGAGSGSGLQGGPGLAGGLRRGFDQLALAKANSGVLTGPSAGSQAQLARSKVAAARSVKTGAQGQLQRASLLSQRAAVQAQTPGKLQASAFQAEQAFSGESTAGGGHSIGGTGAGEGKAAGVAAGAPDQGGPLNAGGVDPERPAVPQVGGSRDVAPWASLVMMAKSLLLVASMLIILLGILTQVQMTSPPWIVAVIQKHKTMLYGVVAGMAGTAAALGVMVSKSYGQAMQGEILMLGGGITMAAALVAMFKPGIKASWPMVLAGVAGMAAAMASAMSSNMTRGGL